jgi:predicted metal-dependent peptidase
VSKDLPQSIIGARIRLMLDEPYLASAIARFPLINAKDLPWCDTMAVDGFYIYVNPEFCDSLSKDELVFVLAHEVMHCVLGHMDRRGTRDKTIWNYASDYATNLKLIEFGFKMPKVGLVNQKYSGLTSEEIYQDLLKNKDSKQKLEDSQWDKHLDESNNEGREFRAKEFPSPEERKRFRISILNEIGSKLKGDTAGIIEAELKMAKGENVPWHVLLSRFFTGLRKDNYRLMPPNKKHIWRNIYLPSIGTPGPSHIIVAIDTSGSMEDNMLRKILGEIDNLRSYTQCKLTLIQCDAAIHKIDEFDEYELTNFEKYKVIGRGGTSFVPVFDYLDKKQREEVYQFDTVIYITDGFGDFPKESPNYPVLWLITKTGIDKVPFGEMLKLG